MKNSQIRASAVIALVMASSQVLWAADGPSEANRDAILPLLGEHTLQGDKGCDKVTIREYERDFVEICLNRNSPGYRTPLCFYFSLSLSTHVEGNEIIFKNKKSYSHDMFGLPSAVRESNATIRLNDQGQIEELQTYTRSHDLTIFYPIERLLGTKRTHCKALD